MQRIGRTRHNISISIVSVLSVKSSYLLPENISALIEITTIKNNKDVIKASIFQDRVVVVTLGKKDKVDGMISILYNRNMQICKKKGLTIYYQVDSLLIYYVNTVGCQRDLTLTYFICLTIF